MTAQPGAAPTQGHQEWLSLKEARRLLGVNEATLRQWADQGRIRSFRTVGGHRRFSRADLCALTEGQAPPQAHGGTAGTEEAALRLIRRRLQRGGGAVPDWYGLLDNAARAKLRVMGRRMVELALEYHSQPRHRPRLAEEARFLGHQYGTEMARAGVSFARMLEAFGFHQESVTDALERALSQSAPPREALGLARQTAHLGNQVLLAMARAYEETRGQGNTAGGGL